MVRHISAFTFLEDSGDGKSKEEHIQLVREYMERIPELYPAICRQEIGVTLGGTPFVPDNGPVMFADLVQIVEYDTVEDALGYAPSEAHQGLQKLSSPFLKKVTSIDFELEG